jgi:adenosylmethionine-8-amino-7-oxononanoate aminotransferase
MLFKFSSHSAQVKAIATHKTPNPTHQRSQVVRQNAIAQGLLLRPLGKVLYIMLPYYVTKDKLAFVYRGLQVILDDL